LYRYTAEARLVLSYANVVREKCITALANGVGDRDCCAFAAITPRGPGQP
jgi:hypothetical protein